MTATRLYGTVKIGNSSPYTLPTADGTNGQVLTTDGAGNVSWSGSAGGAPAGASYVTLGTDATLTAERVLTAGSGISITDNGAGSTVVINWSGLTTRVNSASVGTRRQLNLIAGSNVTLSGTDDGTEIDVTISATGGGGGGITGSGVSGHVTVWNGTTSVTSYTTLVWDSVNTRLKIGGNPTNIGTLTVDGDFYTIRSGANNLHNIQRSDGASFTIEAASGGTYLYNTGAHAIYIRTGTTNNNIVCAGGSDKTSFGTSSLAGDAHWYFHDSSAADLIIDGGNPDLYIRDSGNTSQQVRIHQAGNDTYIDQHNGRIYIRNQGTTTRFEFQTVATAQLGIGVTPSYALDVNGSAHATSFPTSSDARFKKNVEEIEPVLYKLRQLRPVRFEWNEEIHRRREGYELGIKHVGFIAQDVRALFPELTSLWKCVEPCPHVMPEAANKERCAECQSKDINDAHAVDYARFAPILVRAVLELDARLSALEAKCKCP